MTLPKIHMFWHGPPLSRLEQLCLASFVANGHPVDLYAYEEPVNVPSGVRIADAAKVLPRETLYTHRRSGSVGVWSDWFRYRVLDEAGGIWCDTDVVCVKPLDYADPMIFAWENERFVCGAVLGLPAGHELAKWLAAACEDPHRSLPYDDLGTRMRKWKRRVLQGNRRERTGWGEYGPKGLTAALRHFGYERKILPRTHFFPVRCPEWHRIFESGVREPLTFEDTRAVHLWHNMMRERPGFDKAATFPHDSLYEQLCRRYL